MINYIALIVALSISSVAGYYSIVGLTKIFAGALIPVIMMGVVLEVGKLTTASWLYNNWSKISIALKYYLTSVVLVLMFITSMGIFGFLSNAHLEQTSSVANNDIFIEQIDNNIVREEKRIADAETVVSQLDSAVQVLTEAQRIRGPEGAIAVREAQAEQRALLEETINSSLDKIQQFQQDKSVYLLETAKVNSEIGPIKFISDLIYGSNSSKEQLESAIRIVIIIIVLVFDPLAVLLLIAANIGIAESTKPKRGRPRKVTKPAGGILKMNNDVFKGEKSVIKRKTNKKQ